MNDEYDTLTHHIDIPAPLIAPLGFDAHAILEFSVVNVPTAQGRNRQNDETATCTRERLLKLRSSSRSRFNDRELSDISSSIDVSEIRESKNIMYYNGEILKLDDKITSGTDVDVGIISVSGFGEMPKILHLAKQTPNEWLM